MDREGETAVAFVVLHEMVASADGADGLVERPLVHPDGADPVFQFPLAGQFQMVDQSAGGLSGTAQFLAEILQEGLHLELPLPVDVEPGRNLHPEPVLKEGVVLPVQRTVEELQVNAAADVESDVLRVDE